MAQRHSQTNYNFVTQFQDPDFNYGLCNLTNLSEAPDKPTIKIIPIIELVPLNVEDGSEKSNQADTEILSTSSLD